MIDMKHICMFEVINSCFSE